MIFATQIDSEYFANTRKNTQNIIENYVFQDWIHSFRWIPSRSHYENANLTYDLEIFNSSEIIDKEEKVNQTIFYTILSLKYKPSETIEDSKKTKIDKYFFPFISIFSSKSSEIDKYFLKHKNLNIENRFLMINNENKDQLNVIQAEYEPSFWEDLIVKSSKNDNFQYFQYDEELNLRDFFKHGFFNIEVLGEGNTTNIVLKINSVENLSVVCKIYKKITENMELLLLSHLNSMNFPHIPKLYGLFQIKNSINILFLELIHSNEDTGFLIWHEINNFLGTINNVDEINEIIRNLASITDWDEFFDFKFNKSSELIEKIGVTIFDLHELLRKEKKNLIQISNTSENLKNEDIAEIRAVSSIQKIISMFKETDLIIDIRNLLEQLFDADIENKRDYSDSIDSLINNIQLLLSNQNFVFEPQLIHQDLHLGQMIRHKDEFRDPIILDFEGDPQLEFEDKYKKYPIFVDIAGLCRAFNYIKYNSLKSFLGNKKISIVNSLVINNFDKKLDKIQLELLFLAYKRMNSIKISNHYKDIMINFLFSYTKHLGLDYNYINNSSKKNNNQDRLKSILRYLDEWESYCIRKLISKYFKIENILEHNNEILKNVQLFSLRRVLYELKYEKKFRPFDQILPILGLIDILKWI